MPVMVLVFGWPWRRCAAALGTLLGNFLLDALVAINSYHRQYGNYPSSAVRLSQGDPAV